MNTITRRILSSLLATVLLVLGGWGYWELRNTTRFEQERVRQNQIHVIERLAYSLAYPLWNLNSSEVEKIIRYEVVGENIRAVLVYDDTGVLYAGKILEGARDDAKTYDADNPSHRQLLSGNREISTRDIVNNGKTFGKVVVYANAEHLRAIARQYKSRLAFELLGLIAALSCVQFLVLRKVVIRPMTQLTEWVSYIGSEHVVSPLKLPRCKELETLAASFAEMANRLISSLTEIVATNSALQERDRQLHHRNEELMVAEKTLSESEAFRRRVFDSSRVPIVVMDATTYQYIDCNPAAVEIYGLASREETLGKTPVDVSAPIQYDGVSSAEKARYLIEEAMTKGSVVFEWRHQRSDGNVWDAEVHLMSFRTGRRELLQFTLQDITERKKAEAEVQRLKNYLANIIDSMPSVLVGMDRDGNVTQWNRQAESITGVPVSEALGRPAGEMLLDFFPWIKALEYEMESRHPVSKEEILLLRDGERRFYDLMLYPLVANGIEGTVARIEDVTERARVQELMVKTEKMMSVGGLAAGMAHEINNPLGIISQAAQNIERRVSPDFPANQKVAGEIGVPLDLVGAYFEQREIFQFIRDIRAAAARPAKIVSNMLQFSRKSEATLQPISLADLLDQTVELAASDYDLKKRYDFRSVEIIREYAPDVPPVPAIVVEMEQVLLNLLKNAAQAMEGNPPDRKPRIALRLKRQGMYAAVEVEDNGPGMEEQVRQRVFEPFFTTKGPGIGTGLGLSVSYMIVTQNHKGLLEVDSIPGRGARFTVRLPLAREEQ